MVKKTSWTWACLALLLLAQGAGGAEKEEDKKAEKVEEVRVVASAVIEKNALSSFAEQTTVVSDDQIEGLGAQDLPSALRRSPGVTISRHNIIGSYGGADGGAVYIRGMGSTRPGADIQTLFDGVPKSVGVWTHPLLDTLSIDPVDHIEIHKSAQPLQYGNATFAAINLVPKRRVKPGYETTLSSAYGSYHTYTESAKHGGKVDKFDYYVVQSYRFSQGHRARSDGRTSGAYARLGYELTDALDLTYQINRTDSWARDPGDVAAPNRHRERFEINDVTQILTLSNHFASADGHVKLYYDRGHIDWEQFDLATQDPTDSLTLYKNMGVRARQTLGLWHGGEVVVGLDVDRYGGKFREKHAASNQMRYGTKHFTTVSPYVGVSHLVGDRSRWHVIPSAGIRHNWQEEFSDLAQPQVGIIVGHGHTDLHFRYARGVSYPGIYTVFQTRNWSQDDRWKHLDAETVDHFELGLTHRIRPWWTADVTFFLDEGDHRMEFVSPPPPPPQYTNQGSFRTRGVELATSVKPHKSLTLFAGATNLSRQPHNLPNAPHWTASAGLEWRFLERYRFNMDSQYVAKNFKSNPRFDQPRTNEPARVGAHALVNARLAMELTPKESRVKATAFIVGENLLDREYEYREGYPMPGATMLAGLTLAF